MTNHPLPSVSLTQSLLHLPLFSFFQSLFFPLSLLLLHPAPSWRSRTALRCPHSNPQSLYLMTCTGCSIYIHTHNAVTLQTTSHPKSKRHYVICHLTFTVLNLISLQTCMTLHLHFHVCIWQLVLSKVTRVSFSLGTEPMTLMIIDFSQVSNMILELCKRQMLLFEFTYTAL